MKPANILLDTDRVVLTDFGIAVLDDATAITVTGQMVGSPAFLPPERINGRPATAAADLWSLGVTLYVAMTGRSPFHREDTQATIAAILSSRPEAPAHGGQLWAVVKGLLERDPERRLTSEQARPLLVNAAKTADPGTLPGPRRGLSRLLPQPGRRSRFADPAPDPTAVAPPPTLAAPTSYDPPEGPTVAVFPSDAPPPDAPPPALSDGSTEPAGDDVTATVPAPTVRLPSAGPDLGSAAATVPRQPRPVPLTPAAIDGGGPGRRPVRGKVLVAVGAAVAVAAATPILWSAWPRDDDERRTAEVRPTGEAVVAVTPPSKAPSKAPANPLLDACLVGSWRMISMQVVNGPIDGVDARFSSPGGATTRIWPDGRAIDTWAGLKPLTATVKGRRWEETIKGTVRYRVETRGSQAYFSEYSGQLTFVMKRGGKRQFGGNLGNGDSRSPYTCSDTRMTTYGDKDSSTQSYARVSRTP